MIYCLRDPKGKLIESTAASSKSACWENGFWILVKKFKGYEGKYHTKWSATIAEAKTNGYEIVKCKLIVEKK
jgi:hypothetical protein